ncbi:MAG: hypothetical protein HHJ19_15085 [Polaromonas sp.]|nr:hypothetical protein [Polaromonas sp.]NML86919.1 hypothetical protein [Polaromonas sp.]
MIYIKTELGQSALQNRSLALTPRQRSAFILFDGKRSLQDVLKTTASLGVIAGDVTHLVELGLLAGFAVAAPPAIAAHTIPGRDVNGMPNQNSQDHYSKAYPIATRLTANLGLRGFRLNLAVEAAGDLAKLQELAPKIREAVGSERYQELECALYY